jgi:hypothetical protein
MQIALNQGAMERRMQIGHLDGIIDGELHGWALDTDRPEQAIIISVHIDGLPVAEVLAGYYRSDLATHFKSSGRHGFYIDLARICTVPNEARIDVRLPNGSLLQGSPIRSCVARQPLKQNPTLLFMHIPKTAGTSIRNAILTNYRKSEVIFLYPQEPGFPVQSLSELPLEQRARSGLIVGHWVYYGAHESVPNECLYFTVVRDPISRVWSNYTHLMQSQDSRVLGHATRGSLEEMFESKFRTDLDNMMVRYFAGTPYIPVGSVNHDIYDMARRHLREAFPYVGQQQSVEKAYAWLKTKLDWNSSISVPAINVTEYDPAGQCSESDTKLIRHFNRWDCKLYEDVQQQS